MADEAVVDEDALAREKAAADAAAANQDPLAAPVMQTMAAPAAVDNAATTADVATPPPPIPQTLQSAAVPGAAPTDPRAMTNRFGAPGMQQRGGFGHGGMGGMMGGGILQRIAQMMAQRRQQFQQQMQQRQGQGGRGPWGGPQGQAAPVLDANGQPVPGAAPAGNTGFVPPWMRGGQQGPPITPPVASATANNPLPPGAAPAAQAAQTAAAAQAAAPAPVPQMAPAPQQSWDRKPQQGWQGHGQQRQAQPQQTNAQTQRAPGWANMLGGGFGRAQPQRQGGFANDRRANPQSARQQAPASPAATSSFAAPQPGAAPKDDEDQNVY